MLSEWVNKSCFFVLIFGIRYFKWGYKNRCVEEKKYFMLFCLY